MIRKAVTLVIGVAITAALVWYVLTPETLGAMRNVVATASWPQLALAMLLSAAVQWLRAWRFHIMTSGRFALPESALVRVTFQLNFLNFVLPFRLGELSYPVLMKRAYGQPLLSAAGVLMLARLFDLCTVGAILAAAAAGVGIAPTASMRAILWAVAAGLALGPVVMVFGARILLLWLARSGNADRLPAAVQAACAALGARGAQLAAVALSFAIWLVFAVLAYVAANAVAAVPPATALLGAAAGNLAFALPVNGIGGLGASQAAWVFVVNAAGIAWPDAVISALAVYAATLGAALFFGGAAMLIPRRRASSST